MHVESEHYSRAHQCKMSITNLYGALSCLLTNQLVQWHHIYCPVQLSLALLLVCCLQSAPSCHWSVAVHCQHDETPKTVHQFFCGTTGVKESTEVQCWLSSTINLKKYIFSRYEDDKSRELHPPKRTL